MDAPKERLAGAAVAVNPLAINSDAPTMPPGGEERGLMEALRGAETQDTCASCGGQLAVYRGKLFVEIKPGVREEEKSARARRKSYWGCGACGRPVPINHVRQVKLDAEWEVVEKREAEEAARAAKAGPGKATANEQLNPLTYVAESLDGLVKEFRQYREQNNARIKVLDKAIAKLTAAAAKKPEPTPEPAGK
jgi:hypothetical protein